MMIKSAHQDSRGFTLIEILVTIAILAVVFGLVVTSAAAAQRYARNSQRMSDLEKIKLSLQQYYSDHGYYPNSSVVLGGSQQGLSLFEMHRDGTPFTNCIGSAPGPCTVNRTYSSNLPSEPLQFLDPGDATGIHYCYEAFPSSSVSNPFYTPQCTNAVGNTCQYYHLYGVLEPGANRTIHCNTMTGGGDHHYNYQTGP